MWKQLISSYFSFTKKERTGIFVIISLIIALTFLPYLFPFFLKDQPADSSAFEKEIAALKIKQKDSSNTFQKQDFSENNFSNNYQPYEKRTYTIKGELFYFDPNTLSASEWKRLGVRDKTIATIQNYLSKGGKFYKPEDLRKIWGFFPNEVERLMPYVQIHHTEFSERKNYETKTYSKPEYKPVKLDINNADTSAFIALPGIGSKLAQRIVAFRDKLGGFYKTEQLAETFGLPDSTYQKIKSKLFLSNVIVKQININTATIDEMKLHPYIRYALANAIVQYRKQHGNFITINDIKKIMIITDDIYNKLSPYLTIQ